MSHQQYTRNYNTQTATKRSLLEHWLEYSHPPVLGHDIVYTQSLRAQDIHVPIEPKEEITNICEILKETSEKVVQIPFSLLHESARHETFPLPAFNSRHLHKLDEWCHQIIAWVQIYDTENKDWRPILENLIESDIHTIVPSTVRGLVPTISLIKQYFLNHLPRKWTKIPSQQDYSLINDYYQVVAAVIKLQESKRETPFKEVLQLIYQQFFRGCDGCTQFLIPEHIESLAELEQTIRDLVRREQAALLVLRNKTKKQTFKPQQYSSYSSNSSSKYRNSPKKKSYCSYHKTNTHNTSDCNAVKLQKEKAQNNQSNNSKPNVSYIIVEKLRPQQRDKRNNDKNINSNDNNKNNITSYIPSEKAKKQLKELIDNIKRNTDVTKPIKDVEFKLILSSDTPIQKKAYPVPQALQEATENELNRLIQEGIISKAPRGSNTSPAFIIPKKQAGKIRLVVDYRALNNITTTMAYPFPAVYDILRSIPQRSKVFSQIDLRQGYHQIAVAESDKPKTGFQLNGKHYIYNRLPFGLADAPKFFQKVITDRVGHLPFIRVFLDDILVIAKTEEEHLANLRTLFKCLQEHNIVLNYKKSNFLKSEVNYLGNIVSEKGIRADISAIQKMQQSGPPRTVKELMQLIGTINWLRPYIPRLSQRISKLTDKLKGGETKKIKTHQITWTTEDEEIRQQIFKDIERQITLANPNTTDEFQLYIDASNIGIDAILTQSNQLIGLFSRKLSPAQQNYTVEEKELFAVVEALKHFRIFVFGVPTKVFTDHKNLLAERDLNSSRAERWKIFLFDYNIKLEHIAGKENHIADLLSRAEHRIDQIAIPKSKQELQVDKYNFASHLLKTRKDLVQKVELAHTVLKHPGATKLYNTLKPIIHDKGLKQIAKKVRENCTKCQKYTLARTLKSKSLGTLGTTEPFKHICTDIVGPYNTYLKGKRIKIKQYYVITITDRCTRWTQLQYETKITSTRIIHAIQRWIKENGKPTTILYDQERQYLSQRTQNFLRREGITSIRTSPENPTGNSISKRINQEITFTLAHYQDQPPKKAVQFAEDKLRTTYHSSIQTIPWILKYGYHPLDAEKTQIDQSLILDRIAKNLQETIEKEKQKNAISKVKPGQYIYAKNTNINMRDKLRPKWTGPHKVISVNKYNNAVTLKIKGRFIQRNLKQIRLASSSEPLSEEEE
ncbi:hypothetical protein NEOKW01_0016 [Nematocida sp. AWRm80]|nr:hypothetical protein NEOKW01_0016 [Nematocida sp. AWRm80]